MSLAIHNLHKSFGQTPVLNGIEIEATQGEFLVLLGASGCGKSTLLHCIAGLGPITSGEIFSTFFGRLSKVELEETEAEHEENNSIKNINQTDL